LLLPRREMTRRFIPISRVPSSDSFVPLSLSLSFFFSPFLLSILFDLSTNECGDQSLTSPPSTCMIVSGCPAWRRVHLQLRQRNLPSVQSSFVAFPPSLLSSHLISPLDVLPDRSRKPDEPFPKDRRSLRSLPHDRLGACPEDARHDQDRSQGSGSVRFTFLSLSLVSIDCCVSSHPS
jgi:hypothetical protein